LLLMSWNWMVITRDSASSPFEPNLMSPSTVLNVVLRM
jgi:hypothetical protein